MSHRHGGVELEKTRKCFSGQQKEEAPTVRPAQPFASNKEPDM
jgi:hypothetical protein